MSEPLRGRGDFADVGFSRGKQTASGGLQKFALEVDAAQTSMLDADPESLIPQTAPHGPADRYRSRAVPIAPHSRPVAKAVT
jgi:hypothetical protein